MITLLFAGISFSAPEIPSARSATQQNNTFIDWTKNSVVVVVQNRDQTGQWNDERMQEQTAIHSAEDHLMLVYPDISFDATHKIRAFMVENPSKVTLDNPTWNIDETIYYEGEGVEVIGSIDLFKSLRPLLVALSSSDISSQNPETHSGLIIDARGLNFDPLILPVIYSNDGSSLIHISGFSQQAAQQRLPFRYGTDPAHPLLIRHVGKKAATVRAGAITKGGLTIHPEDTALLPNELDLSAIASSGRVAIIIDRVE